MTLSDSKWLVLVGHSGSFAYEVSTSEDDQFECSAEKLVLKSGDLRLIIRSAN